MKSVFGMPIALIALLSLSSCEFSLTPLAQQSPPDAVDAEATLIQTPILEATVLESGPESPQRRIPATALENAEQRIPESALATVQEAVASGAQSIDLSGRWLLTLPAGFQYRVEFDSLGEQRYRLSDAGSFSGVYQLNGDVLQIVEPSSERLNVFDWQLHNTNSMTLVDETGASGARYVGATIGRQIEWEDAEFPRKVLAIGRPAVPRPESTTRAPSRTARQARLVGTAFNDETHGPYIETDETIVFITGIDAWPEEIVGQSIAVSGMLGPMVIQDQGESLQAQQLELDSWTRSEQPPEDS